MSPNVKEVVSKLHSSGEAGQDLQSCDHSGPDCPHGDNVNQGNIPWASDTQKLKPTDGSSNDVADQPLQKDSAKGQPGDTQAKGGNIPYATDSNTGKDTDL